LQDNSDICVSYAEDLALIKEAVLAAGQIAKDAFNANDSKVWDKSNNSPVTDADIAVNDYLLETLCAARPGYGWLSEETKDDHSRHACPRTFVVDPIDGTRAFIDRTPNFAVSVAIIQDGKSIAGVVFNPLKDEIYEATLGGGAMMNGKAILANDSNAIDGIKMVGYARKFRRLGWPDMDCHVANSMAYRMVLVACGQADATVAFTPKSDWDVVDPNKTEFKDLTQVDFVGAYANFADAKAAWKSAAQRTVDNAHMRYFVLHAHELIDPDKDGIIG